MSKVLSIGYMDKEFDNGTCIGYTECCGETVKRGRCGCDEYCPKCKKILNWGE